MDTFYELLNYDRWNRRLMNFYWICNAIILGVEIVICIAFFHGYLSITPIYVLLSDYICHYIVIPSGLTVLFTVICELLVLILRRRHAKIQPYIITFTLAAICMVVIIVHYSINVIYITCTMPIILSLVYNDRRVLLFTFIFSLLTFTCAYAHINLTEFEYVYFGFTELSTSYAILLVTYLICRIIFDRSNEIVSILTERDHAAYESELAKSRAEAAADARVRFLANMSHEIRTPVNAVIGLAELALNKKSSTVKQDDCLVKIRDSAVGLLEIVGDILDISKIDAGEIKFEKNRFELNEILTDCEDLVTHEAGKKGLRLYFYNQADVRIIGDRTRLRQALLNLLSNAIKFTHKGSVTLFAKAAPQEENTVSVYFEISDTGIGIAKEQLEEIFEPFKQADETTTRNYGGTGLGLSITKNIIKAMGGDIYVKSIPNVGSSFSFSLNFELAGDTNKDIASLNVEPPSFSGDVLVFEDNEMNRLVIKENLEQLGLTVFLAENGQQGLDIIRRREGKPFDLVFMDIHMPVMDGFQTVEKLTEMRVKTPVVAMTADIMTGDREKYLNAGMEDCLYKPFRTSELWACLQKHLAHIDMAAGLMNCSGNEDLYHKSLAMFSEQQCKNLADLEKAIADSNLVFAHMITHSNKNSANIIGAKKLAELLTILEESLRHDGSYYRKEMLDNYKAELSMVLDHISILTNDTKHPSGFDALSAKEG